MKHGFATTGPYVPFRIIFLRLNTAVGRRGVHAPVNEDAELGLVEPVRIPVMGETGRRLLVVADAALSGNGRGDSLSSVPVGCHDSSAALGTSCYPGFILDTDAYHLALSRGQALDSTGSDGGQGSRVDADRQAVR